MMIDQHCHICDDVRCGIILFSKCIPAFYNYIQNISIAVLQLFCCACGSKVEDCKAVCVCYVYMLKYLIKSKRLHIAVDDIVLTLLWLNIMIK